MSPAAVVFDLDGTLVDSAPDIHAAAVEMLAALGRPTLPLAQVTGFIGRGVPRLVARCLAATGGGEADEALRARALALYRAAYDAAPARHTRAFDGAPELVAALAARGLPLGLCTNKPEAPARAVLAACGFADAFATVVGGDTLPVVKPDPAPLRLCLARLGAEAATTLYVGDSEIDAETAQAAGVPFALYLGGYRQAPAESLGARFLFADFAALAGHLAPPA